MKSMVTALAARGSQRVTVPANPANCTTGTCPPNNINQVTGIVTDYGAIPGAMAGSAGPLGNIYISGSSTSASGGSLRADF